MGSCVDGTFFKKKLTVIYCFISKYIERKKEWMENQSIIIL